MPESSPPPPPLHPPPVPPRLRSTAEARPPGRPRLEAAPRRRGGGLDLELDRGRIDLDINEELLDLSVDELIAESEAKSVEELELDLAGLSSGQRSGLDLEISTGGTADVRRGWPKDESDEEEYIDADLLEPEAPYDSLATLDQLAAVAATQEMAVQAALPHDAPDTARPGRLTFPRPPEPEQQSAPNDVAPVEPASDETLLSDAAELMAAFRVHRASAPAVDAEDAPTVEIMPEDGPPRAPERSSFVDEAARLIRAGQFDLLEEAIERRVAQGGDRGAIGRIRAIAALARGDLPQAKRRLDDASARSRGDRGAQGRFELARALLSLRSGDPIEGVRRSLGALACARELVDDRGEAAALRTLAACYKALGRADLAERFTGA